MALRTAESETFIPGTYDTVIQSRTYLLGPLRFKGDQNLIPANVAAGQKLFKVTGSFTAASTVSSGQIAATADQILSGYSAWVDGAEVQGSMEIATVAETKA